MTVISIDERRARVGVRHWLSRSSPSVVTVAHDLVGLHATDPASVFLSARARVRGFTVADLEAALYDDRSLVRMLGMRRTMFVQDREVAATMEVACSRAIAVAERKKLVKRIEDGGLDSDGAAWLRRAERKTLQALDAAGPDGLPAAQLSKQVPELAAKIPYGEGKKWAGHFGMSTQVLWLLSTDGHIMRGRPLGTWLSSQYRWSRTARWLGEPLAPMTTDDARADLARRWLTSFGPGTFVDLQWWTKWTVRQTRDALAGIDVEEVELEGSDSPGLVVAGDTRHTRRPASWVALLPALDATTMGWKERDWYLGPHAPALFDTNGNAGPTIWLDGRIVGGWGQRADGTVAYELLERVPAPAASKVKAEAARLESWLAGVRVPPRFRTPLERELATA